VGMGACVSLTSAGLNLPVHVRGCVKQVGGGDHRVCPSTKVYLALDVSVQYSAFASDGTECHDEPLNQSPRRLCVRCLLRLTQASAGSQRANSTGTRTRQRDRSCTHNHMESFMVLLFIEFWPQADRAQPLIACTGV
jgi:hypothetical protein